MQVIMLSLSLLEYCFKVAYRYKENEWFMFTFFWADKW